MANDNQNHVLDENTQVLDAEKAAKPARKAKPKASEGGTTASLF
ncbi:RNA polymerase-binding protein DksA, partial [Escherichia coli]|nr:RNA polymerase-binding protein DksA [Escherichia coli]